MALAHERAGQPRARRRAAGARGRGLGPGGAGEPALRPLPDAGQAARPGRGGGGRRAARAPRTTGELLLDARPDPPGAPATGPAPRRWRRCCASRSDPEAAAMAAEPRDREPARPGPLGGRGRSCSRALAGPTAATSGRWRIWCRAMPTPAISTRRSATSTGCWPRIRRASPAGCCGPGSTQLARRCRRRRGRLPRGGRRRPCSAAGASRRSYRLPRRPGPHRRGGGGARRRARRRAGDARRCASPGPGSSRQQGDIDGAIAGYEALYAEDSGSPVLANNLASLIASYRDDPASLERAFAIARRLRGSEVPAFPGHLRLDPAPARRQRPGARLSRPGRGGAARQRAGAVPPRRDRAGARPPRRGAASFARAVAAAEAGSPLPQLAAVRQRLAEIDAAPAPDTGPGQPTPGRRSRVSRAASRPLRRSRGSGRGRPPVRWSREARRRVAGGPRLGDAGGERVLGLGDVDAGAGAQPARRYRPGGRWYARPGRHGAAGARSACRARRR